MEPGATRGCSFTFFPSPVNSGGEVMLIDVQSLGPLSAAGAGNCFHLPPPNARQHGERKRTCFHAQSIQQESKRPPPATLARHLTFSESVKKKNSAAIQTGAQKCLSKPDRSLSLNGGLNFTLFHSGFWSTTCCALWPQVCG